MNVSEETFVCVLTPPGRGAVAVVAVEGKAAVASVDRFFQAANRRSLDAQPIDRIVYGRWAGPAGEDLVVCRRAEDRLEVHCHGGRQSSAQILADLQDVGCRVIDADQWLVAHHECPLAAAAHRALGQAATRRTASILLDQYRGALRLEIEAIVAWLAAENLAAAAARLAGLLEFANVGCRLTEPWRVVIAGEPNVGKSSLINALVGFERAIVFDQPGTTRDVVSSATAIDGWPVELSDTAGLHETSDTIESAGIALARQQLIDADLVVWVLDAEKLLAAKGTSPGDLARQQVQASGVELDEERTLLVINKIDLVPQSIDNGLNCVNTCAVTGAGLEQLLSAIAKRLVPVNPSPNTAMPFTQVQVENLQSGLEATNREELDAAAMRLKSLL